MIVFIETLSGYIRRVVVLLSAGCGLALGECGLALGGMWSCFRRMVVLLSAGCGLVFVEWWSCFWRMFIR